jgi:DNA processing protein
MRERLFEIWFSLRCGVANREFIPVLEQCGSPYQVFTADECELEHLPCGEKLKRDLADRSLEEADRIACFCEKNDVHILFWQDAAYPASLRTLVDPPLLLYYRGQLPDFAHLLCVGTVGTRTMSAYGKRMAYKIGYELGAAGAVVVSGMALGVDSVAAAGAMAAGGRTVAILGCGIDVVYPREHEALREVIVAHGVVMTEYPPSTAPSGSHFPVRNRLISGLSQATVVVEAGENSGALITAKDAILQGRGIYAVPGQVGEDSASGTNRLIRDGAAVALGARDILEDFAFLYREYLNMGKLLWAEQHSEPDENLLAQYGVSLRTRPEKRPAPPASGERPVGRPAVRRSWNATDGRNGQPDRTASPGAASEKEGISRSNRDSLGTGSKGAPARRRIFGGTAAATAPDNSRAALDSLTPVQRALFELLPLDHAVLIDALTREGYTTSEVVAAMTVLEIKGLVDALPGGLYARR